MTVTVSVVACRLWRRNMSAQQRLRVFDRRLRPRRYVPRLVVTVGVAVSIGAGVASPAGAAGRRGLPEPAVVSVVNASGVSPWAGLNCIARNQETSGVARMGEPAFAVNPRNRREQSVAWMDTQSGPADTAFTLDGGRSWHKALPVGTDPCTGIVDTHGRTYEGSADPWLSYGINGTLYFSSMPFSNFFTAPTSSYIEPVAVERAPNSSDWSLPVNTPDPLMAQDKPEVLADRAKPSFVYTLSRNAGFGLPIGARGDGQLLFARSADGGRSFTETVLGDAHSESEAFGIPQLVQLADGTLVASAGFPASLGGGTRSLRSTDRGAHWSAPSAPQPALPASATLKACGTVLDLNTWGGQEAVLNGRTILAINVVNRTARGSARIIMSRSSNAGRSWVN